MQDKNLRLWEDKAEDLVVPSSPDFVTISEVHEYYRRDKPCRLNLTNSSCYYTRESLTTLRDLIDRVLADTAPPVVGAPVAVASTDDETHGTLVLDIPSAPPASADLDSPF